MDKTIKTRIRAALTEVARKHETISYRMLAIEAAIPGPQIIHKLTTYLEEIIREDQKSGKLCLGALAVSRGHPPVPRSGFFILLRALGLYQGPDQGPIANAKHIEIILEIYRNFPKE